MSKRVFIGIGHGGSDPGAVQTVCAKATPIWSWDAW